MSKNGLKLAGFAIGFAVFSFPIQTKAEGQPTLDPGIHSEQKPVDPALFPSPAPEKQVAKPTQDSAESNGNGNPAVAKEKEIYKSPLVGNIPGEYIRNLQVTPEQNKIIRSNSDLWLQDRFRVGFSVRPRYESINNMDFNKTTADNSNVFTGQTQFYLIADINKYVIFKATLQDSRVWGGEQSPAYTGTSRFELGTNGGVVYDTTKTSQNQVPVLIV